MAKEKQTLREIILEGLIKFGGEIVGVVLIASFLAAFPSLRTLFTDYVFPEKAMSDAEFVELCKSGNAVEVEEAIRNGANVNAKDNDGNTALMRAVLWGATKTTEVLLKHGVHVNAKNNNGDTALMWATGFGNIEIANLLRSYGAKE